MTDSKLEIIFVSNMKKWKCQKDLHHQLKKWKVKSDPLKNRIKLWTFFGSKSGHFLKKNWTFFLHNSQISFRYLMIYQTREVPNIKSRIRKKIIKHKNKWGKCKKKTTYTSSILLFNRSATFETKNVHSGLSDVKYVLLLETSIEF